jgi:hypothetical protein
MGKPLSTNSAQSNQGMTAFRSVARQRKYKFRNPSRGQREAHIDIILIGLDKNKKTSVVSMDLKCITPGSKPSPKWVWLELRDPKGKAGWIYKEADFIVFERSKDFIVVNRKNLVNWINTTSKIRYDLPRVKESWQAKYRLFQRPRKKELITQIQSTDLLKIKGTAIWEKDNE